MKVASIPSVLIEPLEARIAPALLVAGANYLTSGQFGQTSEGDNSITLVKVTSGSAIVWFDGFNVTGISVGPNAGLEITGDVFGDIVANLTASGRLSDSDNDASNGEDGGVLLANNIVGIKTGALADQQGSIGNIITGGNISNLSIAGEIEGIYAGDGVFRTESDAQLAGTAVITIGMDTNPIESGTQAFFTLTAADAKTQPGASIKVVKIASAKELQIFSGSGANTSGATLAGGNIEDINIASAFLVGGTESYTIIAGNGSSGASGGLGGSIIKVIEKDSQGTVSVIAGAGGTAASGGGGGGGSIKNLDLQGSTTSYVVTAGNGGAGTVGGMGGSLVNNNFVSSTASSGLIVNGDFDGDGADDLLVIDGSTGQMVVQLNNGSGNEFNPVTQYVDSGTPVIAIEPRGNTAVSALATDVDGDGDVDIVVAYKNSNSLGIFFNQGGGDFYDDVNSEFAGEDVALSVSPLRVVAGNFSGGPETDYAVISVANNISSVTLVQGGGTPASPVFAVQSSTLVFSGATTAAVKASWGGGYDDLYVGTSSGAIYALTATGAVGGPFFTGASTKQVISGGVFGLDVDSTGLQLIAVGKTSVKLFGINSDGGVSPLDGPTFAGSTGRPLSAKFIENDDPLVADSIAILFAPSSGATLSVYEPGVDDGDPETTESAYVVSKSLDSTASLKTFTLITSNGDDYGVAALGGSLNKFYVDQGLDGFEPVDLPFTGKVATIRSGDGGAGINVGTTIGKGGAGGAINGLNVEGTLVSVIAGNGGDADSGAGGAGGAIINPATFITASGFTIAPVISAETSLAITSGNGGTSISTGKTASGGLGGSLTGLVIKLEEGNLTLNLGNGGNGNGGVGGAGGSANNLVITHKQGNFQLTTGNGGAALSGKVAGGAGGSINNVKYELNLDVEAELEEVAYTVSVAAGTGGDSIDGNGGIGGSVNGLNLLLDAPDIDSSTSNVSTLSVEVRAGAGGDGVNGGNGGALNKLVHHSLFDQSEGGLVTFSHVTLDLEAGAGGDGSAGNGGNGGAILSSLVEGVTRYDNHGPAGIPLRVVAGEGGDGTLKGGMGGAITGFNVQNVKFNETTLISSTQLGGAYFQSGSGGSGDSGDGGKGGDLSKITVGVNGSLHTGGLTLIAGGGGDGGVTAAPGSKAKGGAGGAVLSSTLGIVYPVVGETITVTSGEGGIGRATGGAGGVINGLSLNAAQTTIQSGPQLRSGDGGAALNNLGVGGKGGDVLNISQTKDINSAIQLIEAGNGGEALLGRGGVGGNVTGVKVAGFIGRPNDGTANLGVFDNLGDVQGLYSGRGGDGVNVGAAGSVSTVVARQIAAIGAAYDAVAETFARALKVGNVTADVIGYEVTRDNVFEDSVGGSASPSSVKPLDGFILANAIQAVNKTRAGFVFLT